jgi:hypothetical protein
MSTNKRPRRADLVPADGVRTNETIAVFLRALGPDPIDAFQPSQIRGAETQVTVNYKRQTLLREGS